MQPTYLSIQEFKAYQDAHVAPALASLGLKTCSSDELNTFTAKMLGLAGYDALQPGHARELSISESIHFERCPYQSGRWTAKAGNIIVVFDDKASLPAILMKALSPGEELLPVLAGEFGVRSIDWNHHDPLVKFDYFDNNLVEVNEGRADFTLPALWEDGTEVRMLFNLVRTYEGVILNTYIDPDGESASFDDIAMMFSDLSDGEPAEVDQASAATRPLPESEGVYYKWLRATRLDDKLRLLNVGDPMVDEVELSDLMFETPDKAREAVADHQWGYGPEDMNDCVLVQVTRTVVPK